MIRHSLALITALLLVPSTPLTAADVKQSGAIGDGRSDDTAAIQRAVDKGGHVTFSEGIYRITRTIVIDLERAGFTSLKADGAAKIIMAGSGPAFRFVGTNEARETLAKTESHIWNRQRMPLIDALSIEAITLKLTGSRASGTIQLTITRTHVRRVRHGIHLVKSNRNVILSNCHIYANSGIGIFYDDVYVHQSNITGCHISYNLGGGVVSRAGDVRNIQISGCDLEANMGPGAPPTANVFIDSRGSIKGTAEIAITGCTIQHTYKGSEGANIRILGDSEEPDTSDNKKVTSPSPAMCCQTYRPTSIFGVFTVFQSPATRCGVVTKRAFWSRTPAT